jgi:hypothetical protein
MLLIVLLRRLRFRFRHSGLVFVTYMAAYSAGQLLAFIRRSNEVIALGLKQGQLTAVAVLAVCVPLAWFFAQGAAGARARVPAPPAAT